MSETQSHDRVQGAGVEKLAGLGRVLIVLYLIFAIAATFRSLYQILTKFNEAPLAYSLSAVSGVVYIVAAVALLRGAKVLGEKAALWRRVAWVTVVFELCGVLVVGTLSFAVPQLFSHPSVWSWFGAGYLCIPLVLPVLGMLWLRRLGRAAGVASTGAAGLQDGER